MNRKFPLLLAALALASSAFAQDKVPLKIELPRPLFAGTPRPIQMANLEPLSTAPSTEPFFTSSCCDACAKKTNGTAIMRKQSWIFIASTDAFYDNSGSGGIPLIRVILGATCGLLSSFQFS